MRDGREDIGGKRDRMVVSVSKQEKEVKDQCIMDIACEM